MNKGSIVAITGPSLVGKSLFSSELERIIRTKSGAPTDKIIRVTTRPMRQGEVPGVDYMFVNSEEFSKLKDSGNIIGIYPHNNNMYGIPKESYEKAEESIGLLTIGDPTGLAATIKDVKRRLIPVLVYSENSDVENRAAKRLREINEFTQEGASLRLKAFDNEMPVFKKLEYEGKYEYLLFNPNLSGIPFQASVSHLANRFFEIANIKESLFKDSSIWNFREAYIDGIVKKMFDKTTSEILNPSNSKKLNITISDEVLKNYASTFGVNVDEFKKIPILGVSRSHGIMSVYIEQKEGRKDTLCNLLEISLGVPQYRYNKKDAVQDSPMSLKDPSGAYTNFYLSFSPAYDMIELPRQDSPLHVLTIEAIVDNNKNVDVYALTPERAQKAWASRSDIIRNTVTPHTNY